MDLEINDLLYKNEFFMNNDKVLQAEIYSSYLFKKLKYDENEAPPSKRGEYYNVQKELGLFMMLLDSFLCFYGYGLGKTCGYVYGTEMHREAYSRGESNIRKFYIVLKNDSLEMDFKKQFICRCNAREKYENVKIRNANTENKLTSRVNKSIGKYYEITHYGSLSNRIDKLTDEELKEEFSNCGFVFDEVHYINNPDKKNEGTKIGNILRIVDVCENIKIFGFTATPATNSVQNYISLINLVNKKKRISLNTDISKWSFEKLEPYIRNKIIYAKEEIINVDVKYMGRKIENTNIYTYPVRMKRHQEKIFNQTPHGTFKKAIISCNNFVYPDGSYGKDGFNKHFELVEYTVRIRDNSIISYLKMCDYDNIKYPNKLSLDDYYEILNDKLIIKDTYYYPNGKKGVKGFNKYFKFNSNLEVEIIDEDINRYLNTSNSSKNEYISEDKSGKISILDYNIIDTIISNNGLSEISSKANEALKICLSDINQKVFIYDDSLVGCLYPLTKCLEYNGYEKFTGENNIFINSKKNLTFCSNTDVKKKVNDIYRNKKLRYAIITQHTPKSNINIIFDAFNSEENVEGDIIQVILLSRKTREGISLYDTTKMIRFSAPWNMGQYMQALYRILRITGFRYYKKYYNVENVYVNIYNLSNYNSDGYSLDDEMYINDEEKEKELRKIFRFMKIASINCFNQLKRNIKGQDNSLECDYMKCKYECYSNVKDEINYESYNVLNSNEDVIKCMRDIFIFFKTYSFLSLESFIDIFEKKGYTKYIIIKSLQDIIYKKMIINDIYGFPNFIYENGGYIYISRNFSENNNNSCLDSYYSKNIITYDEDTFNNIKTNMVKEKIKEEIKIISSEDKTKLKLDLYSKELKERQIIFENYIENDIKENLDIILETSKFFYMKLYKPIHRFKYVLELTKKANEEDVTFKKDNDYEVSAGRGRKKAGQEEILEKILKNKSYGKEELLIHCFDIKNIGGTSYISNIIKCNTNELRIFSKGEWRNANNAEKYIYQHMLAERNSKYYDKFNKYTYYGLVLPKYNGEYKFKLVYNKNKDDKDLRNINKGEDCLTIQQKDEGKKLIEKIRRELDIESESKKEMCEEIKHKLLKEDKLLII